MYFVMRKWLIDDRHLKRPMTYVPHASPLKQFIVTTSLFLKFFLYPLHRPIMSEASDNSINEFESPASSQHHHHPHHHHHQQQQQHYYYNQQQQQHHQSPHQRAVTPQQMMSSPMTSAVCQFPTF